MRIAVKLLFRIKDKIRSHIFKLREDVHPSSFILQYPSSKNRSAALFCYKSSNSFSCSAIRLHARYLNRRSKGFCLTHSWTCLTQNAIHFPLTALYPPVPPTIYRHQTQTMHDLGNRRNPLPRPPSFFLRSGREIPPQAELIISYLLQKPIIRNLPHLPPKCKVLVALTQIGPITPAPTQSTSGSAVSADMTIIRITAQKCVWFARTGDVATAPKSSPAHTFCCGITLVFEGNGFGWTESPFLQPFSIRNPPTTMVVFKIFGGIPDSSLCHVHNEISTVRDLILEFHCKARRDGGKGTNTAGQDSFERALRIFRTIQLIFRFILLYWFMCL